MPKIAARLFVEDLHSLGRRSFTRREAERALRASETGAYQALRRLTQSGVLAMPVSGFYVITGPEHRSMGAPPPEEWIDDLMKHRGVRYYVGLRSAVAFHESLRERLRELYVREYWTSSKERSASEERAPDLEPQARRQPSELQVVAAAPLRPIEVGRLRVRFIFRRHLEKANIGVITERFKTSGSSFFLSNAETTALDLVRYPEAATSTGRLLEAIGSVAGGMNVDRLESVARRGYELPILQRLGLLLSYMEFDAFPEALEKLMRAGEAHTVWLHPRRAHREERRDSRWHVRINGPVHD